MSIKLRSLSRVLLSFSVHFLKNTVLLACVLFQSIVKFSFYLVIPPTQTVKMIPVCLFYKYSHYFLTSQHFNIIYDVRLQIVWHCVIYLCYAKFLPQCQRIPSHFGDLNFMKLILHFMFKNF